MDQRGEVLFERRGTLGLVTLDRPERLNALTVPMMRAMRAQLEAWARDEAVTRVAVRGSGGRAFCAGGDIREVYALARSGRHAETMTFWAVEYGLDALIGRYPKPYVALIDGIVMGGGVGISLHGSHRVATDAYLFAMPETGIGYFPDVGATHALPRLPGRTGTYLALTGARIGPGDALALGLATHAAAREDLDAILEDLAAGAPVAAVLAARAAPPPPTGPLVAERGTIDACFSAASVTEVLGRLDAAAGAGSAFAAETAALIRTRSPTSLVIAFELMRRGPDLDLPRALLTEYRLAARLMRGHDFFEGVRAAVIDRDGRPAWRPPTLGTVDADAVAAAFDPLDGPEPDFGPSPCPA